MKKTVYDVVDLRSGEIVSNIPAPDNVNHVRIPNVILTTEKHIPIVGNMYGSPKCFDYRYRLSGATIRTTYSLQ